MAAILRVADALDREHRGKVTEVAGRVEGDTLVLEVSGAPDRELEEWTVRAKAGLLRGLRARRADRRREPRPRQRREPQGRARDGQERAAFAVGLRSILNGESRRARKRARAKAQSRKEDVLRRGWLAAPPLRLCGFARASLSRRAREGGSARGG